VDELRDQGLGLAAISYDSTEILADFTRRHGITFPLLSDAGSATITQYGILNTVAEEALGPNGNDPAVLADVKKYVTVTQPSERFTGTPFPGTFMLDPKGTVNARFFEDIYQERNTASSILLRVGAGGSSVPGTEISTNHIQIKTYPSDSVIALGQHFSLAVEITPLSNMHVYAPGAESYRVVTLHIDPQPFVRLLPMQYPASETYFFEPLNERVPVYQKPFTLLQKVLAEVSQDARDSFRGKEALSLTGSLEYQACDDQICYNPISVPLSWTMKIRPFVSREARTR
jgi:peroxiredoxin